MREEHSKRQCRSMDSKLARQVRMASQLGHDMFVSSSLCGRPLHACRSCGRFAARQFRKLLEPCPGTRKPRTHAWKCLFQQARHPNSKHLTLGPFARVRLPKVFDSDVFDLSQLFGHLGPKKGTQHNHSRPLEKVGKNSDVQALDDPEGELVSESD